MTQRTIELSPETAAFYSGVGAGDEVYEEISTNPNLKDKPHHVRHGWYWLQVGLRLAAAGYSKQDLNNQFIQGASLRQPSLHGLSVHVDTSHDWFEAPEGVEAVIDYEEERVAEVLRQLAGYIHSGEGSVVTTGPRQIVVGRFEWKD